MTLRRLLVLASIPIFSALPAQAVTIDSFTTNQANVASPPGGATVVTGGADIIGTRRAIDSFRLPLPGTGIGAGPVQTGVSGGALNFLVTATTPDTRGEGLITWDGDAVANNLNFTGLAGANLTASNHSAFRILVNSAGAGTEIVVDVFTSATASSRGFLRIPTTIVAPTSLFLSYQHDFVQTSVSPADFTSVGAIQMRVRSTEVAAAIDLIETIGPSVTANKQDQTVGGMPIAAPILEGTTFKYQVTLSNTSGLADGVDFTDSVDTNTALIAASIRATPVAIDDSFLTVGNVGRSIGAPGLLANDVDPDNAGTPPELVIAAGSVGAFATALGGSITIAADGSFTYEPPVGVGRAIDTFQYTVQDNDGQTGTGLFKIAIGPRIWFVEDAHGGTNAGTLANPFIGFGGGNVAGAGGVGDQDAAGDIIFLFAGTQTTGIELEADQRLWGNGDALTIDGMTIVAAGIDPVVTNAAGNGILLSTNNTLNGLTVGATTGVDIFGSSFGTLAASNVVLNGGGGALDLDNGALNATFDSIASTSGVNGIDLDTVTGTLTSLAGTTISGVSGTGIRVTNGGSTYSFGTTSINAPVGANLTTNATSTFSFTSLAITATAGSGLIATNSGTLNISGSGNTIAATGGPAINVTGTSLGAGATFSTVSSSGSPTTGINLDTVTGNFIANGGSITTAAGIDVDINAGSSTITYAGTITNAASRSVEITGRTGGTVTISGNINDTGTGIHVANNNSSGTPIINFSGSTKTINTGINAAITLDNNDVATINFTGGGLDIDTTSGTGFNATGGAAGISVQGIGNTINSTTGTALNVASTTIAALGLNFQSVTAGTGAGSAGVGISVVGSGLAVGNGGLNVTGSGSAGTGGTIQHKTGADGSTTAGIGIYLQDTKDAKFAWIQLNDFDNSAIVGRNVQGFELTNSIINGIIGTSSAPVEGPIMFGITNPGGSNGLQGTGLFRNVKVRGGIEHNMEFYNQSGSMTLTIEGLGAVSEGANPTDPSDDVADCIIEENSLASGGDGILLEMQGTATATVVVSRCLFRDNKSQAIQMAANDSSVISATISESRTRKFDHGNEGFLLSNGANGDLTALITNNHVNNYGGVGIFVGQTPGNATTSSLLHATITNNTVNQPTSATNHGILAFLTSTVGQVSPARIRIDGNTVVNNSTAGTVRGILVDTPDASTSPNFHATVTNNSVAVGDNVAGVGGLVVQARQSSTGCANIGSNTVTFPNGNPGVFGIRARQQPSGTLNIEETGACTGTAAAVLTCRNPASTTEVLGTVGVVAAGTCFLPLVP